MTNITDYLKKLQESGNFRSLREDLTGAELTDLSSNDYLGLAGDRKLHDEFFSNNLPDEHLAMTASASRLLSLHQQSYFRLERYLGRLYGRPALLFNSGYHANSGIIPALCGKGTLIVCDRLVHASIIDGIILSRAQFIRYKHNDLDHLTEIIRSNSTKYSDILVITESVFSMDGDICDLSRLIEIKKEYPAVRLYVDEAHGFGVFGQKGLGLCEHCKHINDIDVIIGTLGKAGASVGAFAITDADVKDFLINTARSFIFSTALPPVNCEWSLFMLRHIIQMDKERDHLLNISYRLNDFFISMGYETNSKSQIIPLITGDSHKVISLSKRLLDIGYIALPIRTPTVPKGTERIRFSLNAKLTHETIDRLISDLKPLL